VYVYYESLKRDLETKPIYEFRCDERLKTLVVYFESLKRELKTTYGYRCDERLKTNVKESTRLTFTPLCAELEHLKIETRLTSETPVSEMGEYVSVML
jgi:hypothetical protein